MLCLIGHSVGTSVVGVSDSAVYLEEGLKGAEGVLKLARTGEDDLFEKLSDLPCFAHREDYL